MNEIKLFFGSDFQSDPKLEEKVFKEKEKSSNIFGYLEEHIQEADIAAINIEYPLTSSCSPIAKSGPILKGSPELITPLKTAGFNLANLSNNHTYNFGNEGVEETIKTCRDNNIDTVGSGTTLEEARSIYYKKINNKKIAILNFAEHEFNTANEEHGGANPLDIVYNIQDINKAKKNADFVFLVIHGGSDFIFHATPNMVRLYRFYAEQGVTAIIGHHSHLIGPYEVHKGVPIFYSLGNFIHAAKGFRKEYYIGFAIEFIIKEKDIEFNILPYHFNINDISIKKLNKEQQAFFDTKTKELNNNLKLSPVEYEKIWGEELMREQQIRYLALLSGVSSFLFKSIRKVKMLWLLERLLLIGKKRYLFQWNILRCEHHKDVINEIFEKTFKHETSKYNK